MNAKSPIFTPRRQRDGWGPWFLLAILILAAAGGVIALDYRQSERVADLRTSIDRLRAAQEGAAKARTSMNQVASAQQRLNAGQIKALWAGVKSIKDRLKQIEPGDAGKQTGNDAAKAPAPTPETAAALQAIRRDLAAMSAALAALGQRLATIETQRGQTPPSAPKDTDPAATPPKKAADPN